MGRHSRPEDLGDEGAADVATETLEATGRPTPQGRHSAAGDQNGAAAPDAAAETDRPKPAPEPSKHGHGTAADLRLIRDRADVRNRCIAAVIVPFVVFTAAMFAIGRAGDYLFWVWLPTIIAGVLVGSILDHAHKRYPEG